MHVNRGFLLIVAEDGRAAVRGPRRFTPGRGWLASLAASPLEALALLDLGVRPDGLIVGLARMGGHGESVLRRMREARPETHTAVCARPSDAEALGRLGGATPHGRALVILYRTLGEEAIRDACRRWSEPAA